jgi:hypothetical protein
MGAPSGGDPGSLGAPGLPGPMGQPAIERDAMRFKDLFCCPVAEISSWLICGSRVPEQSAMLYSSSSGNRLLAISVKLQNSTFETP